MMLWSYILSYNIYYLKKWLYYTELLCVHLYKNRNQEYEPIGAAKLDAANTANLLHQWRRFDRILTTSCGEVG